MFELMGALPRPHHTPPAPGEPSPAPADRERRWPFGASRAVRVPTGYLFIAVGAALAVMALAYSIGFTSGERRRDRLEARRLQTEAQEPTRTIRDPLLSPASIPSQSPASDDSQARTAHSSASKSGDPRTAGMNYFVVAYYGPELAERAAAFLRQRGVDAAVVPANNGRFRYVISLKPFPPGAMGSAEARDHEALLKRLGRMWKRDHHGPDDFSEVWAQKYQPPRAPAGGRRASAGETEQE